MGGEVGVFGGGGWAEGVTGAEAGYRAGVEAATAAGTVKGTTTGEAAWGDLGRVGYGFRG